MIIMRRVFPILFLMIIFTLQTMLAIVFLPVFWSLARIELIPQRILDQALKAVLIAILSVLWLYIFRYTYYESYNRLNRCRDKS